MMLEQQSFMLYIAWNVAPKSGSNIFLHCVVNELSRRSVDSDPDVIPSCFYIQCRMRSIILTT